MKKLLALLATGLLVACALLLSTPARAAMTLAQNGQTSYVIALASDAIPAEKTAAAQLQKYLQQVTGAQFPIRAETEVNAEAPQILVGAGKRAKGLLPRQKWSTLGSDGIVIKTVGRNLILAGGRPRGTLYAVFQFLEDEAGCRWWTPTENTVPRRNTLRVPKQNVVYVPPFNYREHYTSAVQSDPVFATILRENGHHQRQNEEWGGHYNMLGFVHTFSKLLPPEQYFKAHPEWYSDPQNGNRPGTEKSAMPGAQQTQLCLSNPQVLDALTGQALAWIEKNPDAGYISISQNDSGNYCRDAASMKLAEEEGSQAAPVLDFINKVVQRIHAKYPDFKVETLAYAYSEKPPKTLRPARNVIIRLAPISSDFGHPLNSDWNAATRDNLLDWARIAPELFVWNYVTNFRGNILPHPNWAGLGPDLRFFARNNVTGVFEQGDNYTNGVGDFVQLRAWLIGKLMWNPELSQEKLTDEFLRGYYGAAAPYLKQYLEEMQRSFLAQKRKLSTFNQEFSFITLDTANDAIQLFDRAEAAVRGNPQLLRRVQRERLSLRLGVLYHYNVLRQIAAREGKPFLGPDDPSAAMTNFIEAAQEFGVRRWSEGATFESQIPRLKGMFAPPLPLPEFARKYPAADVIDLQPVHFRLYREGSISRQEKDPAASGGTAASVVGDTNEWAIQADLSRFLENTESKWHIYAMARVELKPGARPTGAGFSGGIYDATNRNFGSNKTIPLKDVAGETYQRVDLGVQPLNSGVYIWLAPTRNPVVERVYLDRIILIREK